MDSSGINHHKGSELLAKCKPLEEYSLFIETARKHKEVDKVNCFDNAIKECIEKGILKEYLERKGKEVADMLTAEYDYATDIAVQRREAAEEAWEKASQQNARNFKRLGVPLEIISQGTGLSIEEIENL